MPLKPMVDEPFAVQIIHGIEIALNDLNPVEIDSVVLLLNLRLILRGHLRGWVWFLAVIRCRR